MFSGQPGVELSPIRWFKECGSARGLGTRAAAGGA